MPKGSVFFEINSDGSSTPLLVLLAYEREVDMSCERCQKYPAPKSTFREVAQNDERTSVLYQCRYCGQFFEEVTGERGFHPRSASEAVDRFGPAALGSGPTDPDLPSTARPGRS